MFKLGLVITLACSSALAQPSSDQRIRVRDVVTFAPAYGVATVGPMKPPWCAKAGDTSKESAGQLQRLLMGAKDRGWVWGQHDQLARMVCMNPDDPKMQEQTGQLVQVWVNQTGLEPAVAIAHITARMDPTWNEQRTAACAKVAVSREATGVQRELGIALQDSLGCGNSPPFWFDRNSARDKAVGWYLDDSAVAPQVLEAYWVLRCLPDPFRAKIEDFALTRYASCGVDARRLDEKLLERELETAGWNDYAKITAREHHAVARRVATRYLEEAKALGAKDPDYQRVLIDAPEKGWADWMKLMETYGDSVATAIAYGTKFETAGKRPTGCKDGMRAALATWVTDRHAVAAAEVRLALSTGVGYVLASHLMACLAAEGLFHSAYTVRTAIDRSRPARGPRMAAQAAALDAIVETIANRPRFPLRKDVAIRTGGDLVDDARMMIANGKISISSTQEKGVVKAVTRDGDWSVVTFRTETWQETNWSCTDTNRVSAIDLGTGKLYYDQNCTAAGKRTVSNTPSTVRLIAADAAAIKAGMFVVFRSDSGERGDSRRGMIEEVWATKDQKKLVAYRGFAL